jgi:DNA-binding CsgD family transcriptional regulator
MKHARLIVYQRLRNPTEREHRILTLVAEGHPHKQAAGHLGLAHRSVTNALGRMRDRYTAPTNEALTALAIRLQWIAVAIDVHQPEASP